MGISKIFSFGKTKPIVPNQDYYFRVPSMKGTPISQESSMKVAAFYRGVTYISSQIAKLPWEIKDGNKEKVYGKIWKLLNRTPNGEVPSFIFKMALIQWSILNGNGYAEIERDRLRRPKALWLLNPNHVQPVRLSDNKLMYRISQTVNGTVYLEPSDIFHIRNLHTKDGITGMNLVDYAEEVLGISRGADIFSNSTFANGGRPSGVISVKGTLGEEGFARLKKDWDESHGGRKTGGTAILEEGGEYKPITHDNKSLQYIETKKFGVLEIARFLGLPPSKLFDSESQTYNNIEHSNLEVATDTLDAWAINCECEADLKLISEPKHKSEMDLYAVFRGDMKTRADYFNKQMQSGAITPNEIREKEGMPKYEGGDKFYIATNNFTPSDRVDDVIDAQIAKKSDNESQEEVENKILETIEGIKLGPRGQRGKRGESVYDIWKHFHDGTEEDFLNWIKEKKDASNA